VNTVRLTSLSHGAGCACKLGPAELAQVLRHVPHVTDSALLVDASTKDDAAVYRLSDDRSAYGTSIVRNGAAIEVPTGSRGIRLQTGDEIVLGEARLKVKL